MGRNYVKVQTVAGEVTLIEARTRRGSEICIRLEGALKCTKCCNEIKLYTKLKSCRNTRTNAVELCKAGDSSAIQIFMKI